MKISAKFDYSSVLYTQPHKLNLLVQVTAPEMDLTKDRVPLGIVACLDNSGSMNQEERLPYAKKSLLKLLDNLTAKDMLSVVLFNYNADVYLPASFMTQENKDKFRSKILEVRADGGTNIQSALYCSSKEIAKMDTKVKRVLFFTDGEPTVGITDKDTLLGCLAELMGGKPTFSLTGFGFGSGHDSVLLTELAATGKGNYSFIQSPDAALSAFGKELGGLLSNYARELSFKFKPKTGVKISKVWSDVDVREIEEHVECRIPEIYAEETRSLVLEVEMGAQSRIFPRPTTLLDVECNYLHVKSHTPKEVLAKGRVTFVSDGEDKTPDTEVAYQLDLAKVMEAQRRAQELADKGDVKQAFHVMQGVTLNSKNASLQGLQGIFASSYSSQNSYNTASMSLRSARNLMGRAVDVNNMSNYIKTSSAVGMSCGSSGSTNMDSSSIYTNNSVQDKLLKSFVEQDGEEEND